MTLDHCTKNLSAIGLPACSDPQAGSLHHNQLCATQAKTDLGAGYILVKKVTKEVTHAQIADANRGTVSVSVNAEGVWVYQFSNAQKQELASLIAGKKKLDALALLSHYKGVSHAGMQISGGDSNTLPKDLSRIKIEVQVYRG